MMKYICYIINKSISIKFITILLFFFLFQTNYSKSDVIVGFIFDGPSPQNYNELNIIKEEITTLTEGEFEIIFPEDKVVTSDWEYSNIVKSVNEMLTDPEVDIIITLGLIASYDAASRKDLQKPVIAPFIIDNILQGIPVTESGTSGVNNLSYISTGSVIERDFNVFYEILDFNKLAFITMDFIPKRFPKLAKSVEELAKDIGFEIVFIPANKSTSEVLNSIPEDVDAVYVSPLLTFNEVDIQDLINGLNKRKLPSFSLLGREEVEKGMLIGINPASDFKTTARRIALNLQEILLGVDPKNIKVDLKQREQLTINMETAREINFYPKWKWLIEADVINEEIKNNERIISLESAILESVRVNLDLLAADKEVSAGVENIRLALSELLPQVQTGIDYTIIDEDRAQASQGTQPEKSLRGSISAEQVIFDESLLSNYQVQKKLQNAREFNRDDLRLDIIQATSIAYLNILQSKTLERVQKENIKLTRSNLELARLRNEIGDASPAEIYRWEIELSTNRINIVESEVETQKAKLLLNRLLHRPLNQPFETSGEDIDDPILFGNDPRLINYIDNPGSFNIFVDYLVDVGLKQSPELNSFDSQIAAQDRILKSSKRAFWLPSLNFGAELNENFDTSGAGTNSDVLIPGIQAIDDTEWSILFSARFPLLRGGAKIAEYKKAKKELDVLILDRASSIEVIEQNIRNSSLDVSASHASIQFANDAAEAARNNLKLVTDSYSRGVVSILDLLDAQNSSLSAELTVVATIYDYLIDLMNLQRATGKFDVFYTPEERDKWFNNLEYFYNKKFNGSTEGSIDE